ncbi:hypothetical protein Ccrd_006534 [Cynara cardunculus var. scolymus]|uniref:Uncharacterized protein n=1 Tax=Cynara cardunculus var. scolymus TaxID=59895 RepID=A0A103XIT0_CYNCS|nr:hypothetical protein Ccrd_006534 [Cynara cardunculus var. scolymus]
MDDHVSWRHFSVTWTIDWVPFIYCLSSSMKTKAPTREGEKMASLFVKGMLLKSADKAYTSTRLKQRRSCENGDLPRLNHHRQRPFLHWIRHGNLCTTESQVGGSIPLRAVLSPESPPLSTAKKVRIHYCISYGFRIHS